MFTSFFKITCLHPNKFCPYIYMSHRKLAPIITHFSGGRVGGLLRGVFVVILFFC